MIIKAKVTVYDFDTVLTFGKYAGKKIAYVIGKDIGYIEFMAECWKNIELSSGVANVLNEYLNSDEYEERDYGYRTYGSGDYEDGCWFDMMDFGDN